MIIGVGSSNPAKTGGTRDAFVAAYGSHVIRVMQSFFVDSGVPHNPVSDIQCIQGARNRAKAAQKRTDNGNFFVGIESGIVIASFGDVNEGWFERTWAVVIDKDGKEGIGSGASFRIPEYVVNRIRSGQLGLGGITDTYTGCKGTKNGNGYCGFVTNGVLCRRKVTCDAVIAALAEFLVPTFFADPAGVAVAR